MAKGFRYEYRFACLPTSTQMSPATNVSDFFREEVEGWLMHQPCSFERYEYTNTRIDYSAGWGNEGPVTYISPSLRVNVDGHPLRLIFSPSFMEVFGTGEKAAALQKKLRGHRFKYWHFQ